MVSNHANRLFLPLPFVFFESGPSLETLFFRSPNSLRRILFLSFLFSVLGPVRHSYHFCGLHSPPPYTNFPAPCPPGRSVSLSTQTLPPRCRTLFHLPAPVELTFQTLPSVLVQRTQKTPPSKTDPLLRPLTTPSGVPFTTRLTVGQSNLRGAFFPTQPRHSFLQDPRRSVPRQVGTRVSHPPSTRGLPGKVLRLPPPAPLILGHHCLPLESSSDFCPF